jgi:hypothetical protein
MVVVKLGWPCIICGHFPEDYEEQDIRFFPQHLRHRHNVQPDFLNVLYHEIEKLNDQKIWVSCQGLETKLLSWPSEKQVEAIEVISGLGSVPPPGTLATQEHLETGNVLDDVISGRLVLPQALEGMVFGVYMNQISRACSHQVVRTRVGASFIQQGNRNQDIRKAWHRMPVTIFGISEARHAFANHVNESRENYGYSIDMSDVPYQDARFFMPQSVCTHIGAIYNWISLRDLMAKRLRNFMQWEINAVMRSIRHDVAQVSTQLSSKLRAGCEGDGVCQQREDLMAPCGKFPNPFEGKIAWRVPPEKHTHGYKFDPVAFLGERS